MILLLVIVIYCQILLPDQPTLFPKLFKNLKSFHFSLIAKRCAGNKVANQRIWKISYIDLEEKLISSNTKTFTGAFFMKQFSTIKTNLCFHVREELSIIHTTFFSSQGRFWVVSLAFFKPFFVFFLVISSRWNFVHLVYMRKSQTFL